MCLYAVVLEFLRDLWEERGEALRIVGGLHGIRHVDQQAVAKRSRKPRGGGGGDQGHRHTRQHPVGGQRVV